MIFGFQALLQNITKAGNIRGTVPMKSAFRQPKLRSKVVNLLFLESSAQI
jgi:hypothetical protein